MQWVVQVHIDRYSMEFVIFVRVQLIKISANLVSEMELIFMSCVVLYDHKRNDRNN